MGEGKTLQIDTPAGRFDIEIKPKHGGYSVEPTDTSRREEWHHIVRRLETKLQQLRALRAQLSIGKTPAWRSSLDIADLALGKAIGESMPNGIGVEFLQPKESDFGYFLQLYLFYEPYSRFMAAIARGLQNEVVPEIDAILAELHRPGPGTDILVHWKQATQRLAQLLGVPLPEDLRLQVEQVDTLLRDFLKVTADEDLARQRVLRLRRPLDHKKFLDMLIDDMEDKYIELLEGTRAQIANVDNYIKRITTALDDDFNTQFYYPAFREVRKASTYWDVTFGQIETTNILANNRSLGKVSPQATMEFDLPKRDILVQEALKGAKAAVDDYGALLNDPSFLALARLGSGAPTSSTFGSAGQELGMVRNVLPGLSTDTAEEILSQGGPGSRELGAALESLIPDPAVYKFETGTGFELRPVIQPDGQAVVFHLDYMYTTNVREPVRADEKHLGRVKRHFVDTDVQLSNFELREVSRYLVTLKASRTGLGVPLLQDIPGVGVLFRPLPSAESSLQQNVIYSQATIFPTLFDLMGLRWAPAVVDLDPLRLTSEEFLVRGRNRNLNNEVFDISSGKVDDFMQVPPGRRRPDLYRTQETIPNLHPNGYQGPGLSQEVSELQEGAKADRLPPPHTVFPGEDNEGALFVPGRSSSGMVPRDFGGQGSQGHEVIVPESEPGVLMQEGIEYPELQFPNSHPGSPQSSARPTSPIIRDSGVRQATYSHNAHVSPILEPKHVPIVEAAPMPQTPSPRRGSLAGPPRSHAPEYSTVSPTLAQPNRAVSPPRPPRTLRRPFSAPNGNRN